jgi:hypothetical protein
MTERRVLAGWNDGYRVMAGWKNEVENSRMDSSSPSFQDGLFLTIIPESNLPHRHSRIERSETSGIQFLVTETGFQPAYSRLE